MKKTFAFLPTLIFCASSAFAADGIWTNNASSTWSTAGNWAGGTVADGAGSLANFSTIDITAARTVTLDTSRTIGQLLFGDLAWTNSGFDWTLASSGGGILTLDNTGGTGGNPPSITIANRSLTISSALAGANGVSMALPRSNYDTTRGTTSSSGNGGGNSDFRHAPFHQRQLPQRGVEREWRHGASRWSDGQLRQRHRAECHWQRPIL